MPPPWPVEVSSQGPIRCGTARWQSRGVHRLTVVVKATFSLNPEGEARVLAPAEIVSEDARATAAPDNALVQASEMAPYLPSAGVLLRGHAWAAGAPVASMAVRLGVGRAAPLLSKTVHVVGDRSPAAPAAPTPFKRIPLGYERAFGGPTTDENPAGVGGPLASPTLPNILHPTDAGRPAGFGPINPRWLPRRRLLGNFDGARLETANPEIPEQFDWRYFHAAPPDQQIGYLEGDEWIILDGLHRDHPQIRSRLPGARAEARWQLDAGPTPIELRADTLVIDADRLQAAVIWRGSFVLPHPDAIGRVRVAAGFAIHGAAITWPDQGQAMARPAVQKAPQELVGTAVATPAELLKVALPFAGAGSPLAAPPAMPMVNRAPAHLSGTTNVDLQKARSAPLPFAGSGPVSAPAGPMPISDLVPQARRPDAVPFVSVPVAPPPPPSAPPSMPSYGPPMAPVESPWARGLAAAPLGVRAAPEPEPAWTRAAPIIEKAPVAAAAVEEAPGTLQLIWFERLSVPQVRRDPRFADLLAALDERPLDRDLDDPEGDATAGDVEDRREIFEILARGAAVDSESITSALAAATLPDGRLVQPIVLVAGELAFAFDELSTLKATLTAAASHAAEAPEAKASLDAARAFLDGEPSFAARAVTAGLTARLRETFEGRGRLAEGHLQAEAQRALLGGRSYDRRLVFGEPHVRALLHSGAGRAPLPTYLGATLAAKLPAAERVHVRLLAVAHPAFDTEERHAVALRVVALSVRAPVPETATHA